MKNRETRKYLGMSKKGIQKSSSEALAFAERRGRRTLQAMTGGQRDKPTKHVRQARLPNDGRVQSGDEHATWTGPVLTDLPGFQGKQRIQIFT